MIRPDEETLRALASLEGDPRGSIISKWFFDSLDLAERDLSDNTVFNAGRVAELADIKRNIQHADEYLRKIRASQALDK